MNVNVSLSDDLILQHLSSVFEEHNKYSDYIKDLQENKRILPPPVPNPKEPKGLFAKYRVYKSEDNSVVEGSIVLRPDKEPEAYGAIKWYAEAIKDKNPSLSKDLKDYLKSISRE